MCFGSTGGGDVGLVLLSSEPIVDFFFVTIAITITITIIIGIISNSKGFKEESELVSSGF